MTDHEKQCLALGKMVVGMINDVRKAAKSDPAYARRGVTFPGGKITLFVVNDDRVAAVVEQAVENACEVTSVTPPSQRM